MSTDERLKLLSLISDYKTYRALALSSITDNPYHAFYNDLLAAVKMCDEKLLLLFTDLKKLEER